MWLLFLSNVLAWSTVQVPSGSAWLNTGLISCSGSSFGYTSLSAGGSSNILVANAAAWHNAVPSNQSLQFLQGSLEIFLWALNSGPRVSLLTADGESLLPANSSSFPLLPTQEQKMTFAHNTSLPHSLRFQVTSPVATLVLFSCAQFRARYENQTTTTGTTGTTSGGGASTGDGLAVATTTGTTWATTGGGGTLTTGESALASAGAVWPGLEWTPQASSPRDAAYFVDRSLVVLHVLCFLLYWAIPSRVRLPKRLALSNIVRKGSGRLMAVNLGHFSVACYSQKEEGARMVPHPELVGEVFCPFIGIYDVTYQVYAVGDRIPLRAALEGAPRLRRLGWLYTVTVILEELHKRDVVLGSLSALWVDPVTQRIAVANYAGKEVPQTEDVHALGRLMAELLGDIQEDWLLKYIEACLLPDPPSVHDCAGALTYLISSESSRSSPTM